MTAAPVAVLAESPSAAQTAEGGTGTELEVVMARGPLLDQGLAFCAAKYQDTYGAHWIATPDVLFVARRGGSVVATAGLEIGRLRPMIDTERYFRLTPGMRHFIGRHRDTVAEFGRFSSNDPQGAKAVIHAVLAYCKEIGVEHLFAWANPAVYRHGARRLGVPFWVIDVPVDDDAVRTDTSWTDPPVRFFLRDDAPRLLLAVVPFFDLVNRRLAEEYGRPIAF